MKQLISYVCAPIRKCTWRAWVMGAMVLSATLSAQGLPDFNFSRSIRDSLGPGIFQNARGIAIDANSIYVTGYFEGTVNFGVDTGGNAVIKSSIGGRDVFVASLNKAGQIKWVQTFGGGRNDEGADIIVTRDGLFVTGYFEDYMVFISQHRPLLGVRSQGNSDIFLLALDAGTGNVIWAQQGNVVGRGEGLDIGFSDLGVYVVGYFTGSIYLFHLSASTPIPSHGREDVCVLQFNPSNGQYIWGGHIGGRYSDKGYAILLDYGGGFWITGYCENLYDVTFREDFLQNPLALIGAGRDAFVLQYRPAKGKIGYILDKMCIIYSDGVDEGRDLAADLTSVYAIGFFGEAGARVQATIVGKRSSTPLNIGMWQGETDVFQLRWNLSSSRNPYDIWVGSMGGPGSDQGTALMKGEGDSLYAVGIFEEWADVDPQLSNAYLYSHGGADIFVIVQDHLQSQNGPHLVGVGQMGGEGDDSCGAVHIYNAADTIGWHSVWSSVCSTYVDRPILRRYANELAFAGFYQDVGDFNPHLYQDSFLPVSRYGWEGFVTHLMGSAGSPSPPVIMGLTPHENEESDGVYVLNPIEGDELKIFLPQESGPSRVMIYSVTGKLMASHSIDGAGLTEIHLPSALPSGAYIIKVLDREGGIIEHATVQKW